MSTAKFYEADTLIMGGDITGKTLVPVVEDSAGRFRFNFQGQEFSNVSREQLADLETRIMNAGLYPYRLPESEYELLKPDEAKISNLFDRLTVDRLKSWAELAEENLAPLGVRCYWFRGNDDKQKVLDQVRSILQRLTQCSSGEP